MPNSIKDKLTYGFLESVYKDKTNKEIADLAECSPSTVDKYLRKYRLYRLSNKVGNDNTSVEDVLTYDYLKSVHLTKEVKEIAKETGTAPSTVRKYLHKLGLSVFNSRLGKNVGGSHKNGAGYVMIYCPRTRKSRREHLVVMEAHLGRPLVKGEVVHHLNGKRDDNRLDNLYLMTKTYHDLYHHLCRVYKVDYTSHSKTDVQELLRKVENVCRPNGNINR